MRIGKIQARDLSHTKQADSPAQYERGIVTINRDTNYFAKLHARQTTLYKYTAQVLQAQCIQSWMKPRSCHEYHYSILSFRHVGPIGFQRPKGICPTCVRAANKNINRLTITLFLLKHLIAKLLIGYSRTQVSNHTMRPRLAAHCAVPPRTPGQITHSHYLQYLLFILYASLTDAFCSL